VWLLTWREWAQCFVRSMLTGRIGFGSIGRRTDARCEPFGAIPRAPQIYAFIMTNLNARLTSPLHMRRCPYCGKEYADDVNECSIDCSPLAPATGSPRAEKPSLYSPPHVLHRTQGPETLHWFNPTQFLKDLGRVFLLCSLAGFTVGFHTARFELTVDEFLILVGIVSFLGFTAGITYVGRNTLRHRWAYLSLIGLAMWLLGLFNLIFFKFSPTDWLFGIVPTSLGVAVGGGIACAFPKDPQTQKGEEADK